MPVRETLCADVSKMLFFQHLARLFSFLPVVPGTHAVPEGMRKNDKMVEKALLQHIFSYANVFSGKFGRPDFDTEADLMHTEAWRSRHFCSFWPVRTPGAPSPAFFCPGPSFCCICVALCRARCSGSGPGPPGPARVCQNPGQSVSALIPKKARPGSQGNILLEQGGLCLLDFVGKAPEVFLAGAADRTGPVVGQILEPGALGNVTAAIAPVGIIDIAAVGNGTAPHIFCFSHETTPVGMTGPLCNVLPVLHSAGASGGRDKKGTAAFWLMAAAPGKVSAAAGAGEGEPREAYGRTTSHSPHSSACAAWRFPRRPAEAQ